MFRHKTLFFVCLLFLIASSFYYQNKNKNIARSEVHKYCGQEISFQGIVVSEPEKRVDKIRFQVETKEIPGKILLTSNLYPEYSYGDALEISGTLEQPAEFEDFNYREYLTKDKIYSVIYYPQIKLSREGNGFYSAVFAFKNILRERIEKVLLPPQDSILKAVLLGDKYGISVDLKEKLSRTGTSHIVAISGMHMVIFSEIIFFLLIFIGFWRQQAFYLVLLLLAGYIILIGAPASAIRAGIMISILLLAQQMGRMRSSGRAIFLAVCLMLLANPRFLIDVGFQLSFAAVLSIVYLKPIFDRWINFPLKDVLTLTLAAQAGVLPILIWHFGEVSLISPLANILIVPLLPFLMAGGLVVLAFPFKIVAFPLWLLLSLIIKIIDILALTPVWKFQYFPWVFAVGWYLVLVLIVNKLKTNE